MAVRPWTECDSLLEAFPVDAVDEPLDYAAEGQARAAEFSTNACVRATGDDAIDMARGKRTRPRTTAQVAADKHANELAIQLGRMLRDRRLGRHATQASVAAVAGMPRTTYTTLEGGGTGGVSLRTLSRAAAAVGTELRAYVAETSAADQPRDAVHLRHQELVLRVASGGGWTGLPEAELDRHAGTSRAANVLLTRGHEWAIFEVWDWFSDVGASLRDWDRRRVALEALAISRLPPDAGAELVLPRVGGCWVARATVRNRKLVSEHRHVFRARFSGSSRLWLEALTGSRPMPADAALLWVRVDGSALLPSRLG